MAGVGFAPVQASTGDSTPEKPSYLFAVNAEGGTVKGIGKDTGKRKLTLRLRGVNDHVTQFADRPFRDSYVMSTRDFAARWDRWFKGNPPNAVLTFNEPGDAMPHSIVVRLKNPRYRQKTGTLTFAAWHIHRKADLSPDAKQRVKLPKRRPPATFIRGSLFIDSVENPENSREVNGCPIIAHTDCGGVDLSGADLAGENLEYAVLASANLSRADLEGTDLAWADLGGADLSGAHLVGADLRWSYAAGANLAGADLSKAQLAYANLSGANLSGAVLPKAGLSATNLYAANLRGANLAGADLSRSTLVWSDLTGANLSGADLSHATLVYSDLTGANLSGAKWPDGRICGMDTARTGKCL